jgi:hypothetical protein
MKNWKKVPDNVIRFIWKCTDEDCDCEKVDTIIEPDWYQHNGTPICEVGCDMDYIRAEVADTADNNDGYAVVETDEDNDLFECSGCGNQSDIENSVRLSDDLYCDECALALN